MGRETLLHPPPPSTTAPTATHTPPPPPPPLPSLPSLTQAGPSGGVSASAPSPSASPSSPAIVATTAVATAVAAPPTSLAPGFRFHPTDEELVIYYLKRKVCGKSFRFDAISEVDIYRSEPWDLADKSRLKTRDQEWYFFSALDKKYGNGGRMNRATSKGYWKATGNDRPVKHEQRTVGLKKTLVFHSGRAPDGKRTNWVMHEYRLVDEELERARSGSSQPQDAYVLCRVFHKNNIGPPNGQRYAPFVEEEWDDASALVPGAEPVEDVTVTVAHPLRIESNGRTLCSDRRNNVAQDTQSNNKVPFDVNKLPIETQSLLAVCKRESMAEFPSPEKEDNSKRQIDEYPLPQTENTKPISQIYKRRRHYLNVNHSNVNGDSVRTIQEPPCSSTITTAATTLPTAATTASTAITNVAPKKHFLSALVEFSLMESLESKGNASVQPPEFDDASLEASVPPNCVKLIKRMQGEIYKLSEERETMRFEMMSAQAMINMLESRIEILSKENEELKSMINNNP
ncbi:NAC domain containing protein 50-like [Arachis stenosperma]|uniref:NAC domain containing protein 50-like n=1 Tax=Arachis stenosperma TaxID=217475 RepID=UPI0025ABE0CD|nr:NAC domain containing protein 50-like [Arachis stenosperma]